MATISITRTNRTLVTPDRPIPSTTHELSFLDKIPVLRCYTMTLHVFGKGPEAPLVIREALSKALVSYHPLAGRLKVLNQDEIQIDCTGETGVWFVEASASCTLQSVGYFENVLEIPYDDLLPDHVPGKGGAEPLVQMQVTQFACGGFVMGLIFSHVICDGLGAAQFLNAVAELARGQKDPTVSPLWHRDFIPRRQAPTALAPLPPPPPVAEAHRLEPASIDISKDQIDRLKHEFHELTGKACSTFEITAAGFWKLRTEAIDLRTDRTEVKLIFFANARNLLDPPLPDGFYGNCFFPVTVTAWSDAIAREYSVFDTVKLIQEAKTNLVKEFRSYVDGDGPHGGDDPFAQPRLGYETLFLSDWGRLGFNQVDYGWGPPIHVVPLQGPSVIPAGIVGSVPLPRRGVRLMTWCVSESDKEAFIRLMKNRL